MIVLYIETGHRKLIERNNKETNCIKNSCYTIIKINRTRFDYKLVCNQFVTTHYVAVYKTINVYYLKKSHDSLNRSCD